MLTKWMLLVAIICLAACTVEKETGDLAGNGGKDSRGVRQEVLLTFKNKLALPDAPTKAAGASLATTAENAVAALDVYVFASDSETGNYTFQERFAYRQNSDELPAGSKELTLEAGSKDNEFTALLSLQKGLFVKLYCIANQPLLVDPANEGNVVADTYFQPLEQSTPGKTGSGVKTEGVPSESLFQSFHTPFITSASDTLVCPLPMSGAYANALDLTDYSVSSRMQVGFKLTRAVARFDIINNASLSRFTLDSIGMNNGRKAVTFFPIQAYGDRPVAKADELVTCPLRAFGGEYANTGTQTGAYYAYPSLAADGGSLLLKGHYKINETETKVTSYPVAFKQTDADGNGAFIEINPNKRYTIAITDADEQELQVTVQTSDWSDDGSIDEYNPGETSGNFAVTIPAGFVDKNRWDAATRTVNMSLDAGSSLDVSIATNSTLLVSKRYAGNAGQYDWLEVSAPAVTATKASGAFAYTYSLSLKDPYTEGRYPKATIRFIDAVTAEESILFVEAIAAPEVVELPKVPGDTNLNSIDVATQTASIFRTTGSSLQIKLLCPDGVDVESTPAWMQVEKASATGAETIFTLTLTDRDVADKEGTITFHNSQKPDELKTDVTVQLQDAGITPVFTNLGGTGNVFTAAHDDVLDNIRMALIRGNTLTVTTTSIAGLEVAVDFDGGSEWLVHNGEVYVAPVSAGVPVRSKSAAAISTAGEQQRMESQNLHAGNKKNVLTFSLDTTRLSGGKTATVTLKNKTGGKDCLFTVEPEWQAVSAVSGIPASFTVNAGATATVRVNVPLGGITAVSANTGIAAVSANNGSGVVTITGGKAGSTTISVYSPEVPATKLTYSVKVVAIPNNYKNINGVNWATGNLVKSGDVCTIGNVSDIGLIFSYGSLVGYAAATGNLTPVIKPTEYTANPTFTQTPYTSSGPVGADNPAAGTGDPCRYYLGSAWRLPTESEFRALGGGVAADVAFANTSVTTQNGVNGVLINNLFFPYGGWINRSNGVYTLPANGYYWSSNDLSNTAQAWVLKLTSPRVTRDSRTDGYTIRCVKK